MNLTPDDLEEFRTMLLGRARSLQYLWDWPPQVDPQDVVALAISKAWQRVDQFRGTSRGEAASWLLSILHHQAVDALRGAGAEKRQSNRVYSFEDFISQSETALDRMLAGDISTASTKLQREELIRAAYTAIEMLPDRQRTALLARFIGQWSIAQIADEMTRAQEQESARTGEPVSRVTEKAVTSLIDRALGKLRDLLAHLE